MAYSSVLSETSSLIARSTLAKTPLPEFLVRALDDRLEGTLVLQTTDNQKHAVLFLKGAPAKAKLAESRVRLGEVLVDLELLQRSVAVSTQKRAMAQERPHELVLLEEGHLDQTALYVALRELLHREVLALCELPGETVFGLYRANYLANWGPLPEWRVKPLPLVWRALVDHLPAARLESGLRALGRHTLKMRFEAPVSRYHMSAEELAVVDMLRARPQSLAELENTGAASVETCRRVAAALLFSRQLDGSAAQGAPVGTSEPPESPKSVPPPSIRAARRSLSAPRPVRGSTTPEPTAADPAASPEAPLGVQDQAFREAIQRWETAPPESLYDVLGVDPDADTAVIRRAFFGLARQWHPDRLSPELARYRPVVTRAFAKMGEAHQLLTDPVRRSEYDAKLGAVPDEEQAQVAEILGAASAFQRAEILVKKKHFAQALTEARAAHQGDPTQADYAALFAWLSAHEGGTLPEALELASQAVQREPENVRALWYRGQLLKRAGRDPAAMKDFKKILSLKPSHVEAARELRVFEMRRRSAPKDGGGGGLLGRFIKKG